MLRLPRSRGTVCAGHMAATAMLPAEARAAIAASPHAWTQHRELHHGVRSAAAAAAEAAATGHHTPQDADALAIALSHHNASTATSGATPSSHPLTSPGGGGAAPLVRPGTTPLVAARVPFKVHKPLKPRVQSIIDSRLIALRRKEHPEWLTKRTIRKMTLHERKTLLTKLYQEWDLEELKQKLDKCRNANASLQYIDRAHDLFCKVHSFSPLGVYHSMMRAAARFHQTLRMDEYFRVLLRVHTPTPVTFAILLQAHAAAGHTKRVEEILLQMQGEGVRDLVADQLPPEQPTSPDALVDPTQRPSAAARKLARHVDFSYPFTEKSLFYLLQSHAVNNDTVELQALVSKLERGESFYPKQLAPLQLTLPIAELLMHSYALHRQCAEAVHLLRWVSRTPGMHLTTQVAWSFMDAFKREAAWRGMQERERDGERRVAYQIEQEAAARARRDAPEAPKVVSNGEQDQAAQVQLPVLSHRQLSPTQRSQLPQALQGASRVGRSGSMGFNAQAIRSPFPLAVSSSSLPANIASSYPASPVRRAARRFKPSPLDALKEDAPLDAALEILVREHRFVPGPGLVNAYLGYYAENFFPVQTFPDVIGAQVRVMERTLSVENLRHWLPESATATTTATSSASSIADESAVESPAGGRPFHPNAHTYALLIQGYMTRRPLPASTPQSLALLSGRPGPSAPDVRAVKSLRAEMRERGVAPTLSTKIHMMQLMVFEEKWQELYAAFTIMWKADKMRRERMKKMGAATPASAPTTVDGESPSSSDFLRRDNDASFTCMSLVPVLVALSLRPTLDRFNLFLAIVTSSVDFPLTLPFFQVVLNILADRGRTPDIIALISQVKSKFKMTPGIQQYNSLLASLVHATPAQAAAARIKPPGGVVSPAQQRLVTIFQIWELLKLLKLRSNTQTLQLLLTGCKNYGELVDGQRLWGWILVHAPRPSVALYSLYVEFLLDRGELGRALHALRSQSLKDGHDWTLKECYMLLDYLQKSLAKHAKRVDPEQEAAAAQQPTGVDATHAMAAYVPTPEQQAYYNDIQSRCRTLRIELLSFEKRGGRFARPGAAAAVPVPGSGVPAVLSSHRQHVSPAVRVSQMTLEEKEADEVLTTSSIPATLFQQHMVPLLKLVDKFADTTTPSLERANEKRQHMQLLEASMAGGEQQAEGEDALALEADLSAFEQSAAAQEVESGLAPDAEEGAEPTQSEREQALELMEQIAHSVHADSQQAAAADTPVAAEADVPPAAAADAPEVTGSDSSSVPAVDKEAVRALRRAEKDAKKADKAAKRAARALSEQNFSDFAADTQQMIVKPELDAASSAVASTLDSLAGKAERTRALTAPLPRPQHPAVLDGVDLCTLRASNSLGDLTIPQLKAVQLSPTLMRQQKLLVKGIKSHHIAVVQTWLEQCACCGGAAPAANAAAPAEESSQQ